MHFLSSIRKMSLIAVLLLSAISLSGCIYLVIGGVAAMGGYMVSSDTVEGVIPGRGFKEVWKASVDIVSIMGTVQEQNERGGILIAKIQGAKVTVTVIRMSDSTAKLQVKARKLFMPKIRLAQDVYVKIVVDLGG